MTKWLAFARSGNFRHADALHELGYCNWTLPRTRKPQKGDIVYLFMSDSKSVRFKTEVTEIGVPRTDLKYWETAPTSNGSTYKFTLLDEYKGTELNEKVLSKYGFKGGRSIELPMKNNKELLDYIDSIFNAGIEVSHHDPIKVIDTASLDTVGNLSEKSFIAHKGIDFSGIGQMKKDLGDFGEDWVMEFEQKRLRNQGINHSVEHSSKVRGDGLGFDILSVEDDGITERYIEVKATEKEWTQPFYFSDNEMEFSDLHSDHYYLYRVYNLSDRHGDLIILKGSLKNLDSVPKVFQVTPKSM